MSNTVPKLVAPELRMVLENGVRNKHRSFVIMVGSKCVFQVQTIFNILTQLQQVATTSILWCYKKEQKFSANQEKRSKEIKKLKEKGLIIDEAANQIHLFLSSHKIRYCKYNNTASILGQTFGMLVLQDFQDITPNNLARTIETISGGGTILLLLDKMENLEDLYKVSMSFHNRMKSEAFGSTSNRFISRFLESIKKCGNCVCIDDEYNVLSKFISSPTIEVFPVNNKELAETKKKVSDLPNIGPLIDQTVTIDQARTVLHVIDIIQTNELNKVVGITASRGRGKSAALGLSLAAAIAHNYSNIFVTAPSPENLKTLFEFVLKGFDALGYKEHSDYDLETSSTDSKQLIRINVHRNQQNMRQTISYIKTSDYQRLAQCEILAIDEAAAIPLPIVRKLIGKYTVLMSSTVNGYEGTGRALSLKLFDEFRKSSSSANFSEVELKAPIRYAPNDPIEKWLNSFLCLDAQPPDTKSFPDPNQCELMLVNRSLLFSGNKTTEKILSSIVALSVASHYKNEPDDLILMSDSPNHRIFVLLPPFSQDQKTLPDIICYIQVALEGHISKSKAEDAANRGKSPDGDLIPWTVSKRLNCPDFTSLTGIRIVRIAVHPQMQSKGYGGVAIKQLIEYYSSPNSVEKVPENLPLFARLVSTPHEDVQYAGVSFGLTESLFRFWKKNDFYPVYIKHTLNPTTGEHSMIVLRDLNPESQWIHQFTDEFRRRFGHNLSYNFSGFTPRLVDMIYLCIEPKERQKVDGSFLFTPEDVSRLQRFSKQIIDFNDIIDLMPNIAELYFEKLVDIQLTRVQQTVLICIGLQHTTVDECATRHGIAVNQVFALLQKISSKFVDYLSGYVDMTKSSFRIKTIVNSNE